MPVCAVEDSHSRNQIEEKRRFADYYINSFHDIFNGAYEILNARKDIFADWKEWI